MRIKILQTYLALLNFILKVNFILVDAVTVLKFSIFVISTNSTNDETFFPPPKM